MRPIVCWSSPMPRTAAALLFRLVVVVVVVVVVDVDDGDGRGMSWFGIIAIQ